MWTKRFWSRDDGNAGVAIGLLALVALLVLAVLGMQEQTGVDPAITKAQKQPVTMAQMGISSTSWAELVLLDYVAPTQPPSTRLSDYKVIVHADITNTSDVVRNVEFRGPAVAVTWSGEPLQIAPYFYFTVEAHSRLTTTVVEEGYWYMNFTWDSDRPFKVIGKGSITVIDYHPVTG